MGGTVLIAAVKCVCRGGGGGGGRGERVGEGGSVGGSVCDCVGGCGCDCVGVEGSVWVVQS